MRITRLGLLLGVRGNDQHANAYPCNNRYYENSSGHIVHSPSCGSEHNVRWRDYVVTCRRNCPLPLLGRKRPPSNPAPASASAAPSIFGRLDRIRHGDTLAELAVSRARLDVATKSAVLSVSPWSSPTGLAGSAWRCGTSAAALYPWSPWLHVTRNAKRMLGVDEQRVGPSRFRMKGLIGLLRRSPTGSAR